MPLGGRRFADLHDRWFSRPIEPPALALRETAGYAMPVSSREHRAAFRQRRLLLAVTLTLACTSSPPPATVIPTGPATVVQPPSRPAKQASSAGSTLDVDTVRAEAQRILEQVARARNLALRSEVAVEVIDKAGIRKFAKDSMYDHVTPAETKMLGRIESSLGVLPPGADAEAVLLDLLEDGVLGLYDPKKKTLFVGDFVPKSMLSMVVGHEIAHGLQDMYFDLDKLQQPIRNRGDAESARRFLVEGEAQAAYLAWVSGEQGVAALTDPVLDAMGDQALELAGYASPYPIVARSMQMAYADGTATVVRLVQRKGWGAIDDLYAKLPETTEQMLHLDKLLAREPAIPAKLDSGALTALAGQAGLALVWHDEIGEAAFLAMLAEGVDAGPARRAAAGWGGDHLVAFEGKDPGPDATTLVAAVTAWDTEGDAKEFEAAFRTYLAEHAAGGHVIDRKDRRVVFATGIPSEIGKDALRQALWRGAKVGK